MDGGGGFPMIPNDGKLLHQLFLSTVENTDVKNEYAHLQHPAVGLFCILPPG